MTAVAGPSPWVRSTRTSGRARTPPSPGYANPLLPPPYAGYRCQYDTGWIADKTRWSLSASGRFGIDRNGNRTDPPVTIHQD
ncbi:hypothetical protein [Streptomyces sp. NPDC101776]|uniref:hypothetical protein n=1 Tax=Streptomyces sp. NPDC101776 TaxID=3366146 RepID=UPI0037F12A0B